MVRLLLGFVLLSSALAVGPYHTARAKGNPCRFRNAVWWTVQKTSEDVNYPPMVRGTYQVDQDEAPLTNAIARALGRFAPVKGWQRFWFTWNQTWSDVYQYAQDWEAYRNNEGDDPSGELDDVVRSDMPALWSAVKRTC